MCALKWMWSAWSDQRDLISGSDSSWWWHIWVLCFHFNLFIFFYIFVSSSRVQPKPVNRVTRTIVQKTWSEAKEVSSKQVFFEILSFWGHSPRSTKFSPPGGKSQPKWKDRITWKRLEIGKICQCDRKPVTTFNSRGAHHQAIRSSMLPVLMLFCGARWRRKAAIIHSDRFIVKKIMLDVKPTTFEVLCCSLRSAWHHFRFAYIPY